MCKNVVLKFFYCESPGFLKRMLKRWKQSLLAEIYAQKFKQLPSKQPEKMLQKLVKIKKDPVNEVFANTINSLPTFLTCTSTGLKDFRMSFRPCEIATCHLNIWI